jgi:hypothetical protein
MSMKRREFLAAGLAVGSTAIAFAQQGGEAPAGRGARGGGGGGRGAVPKRMA